MSNTVFKTPGDAITVTSAAQNSAGSGQSAAARRFSTAGSNSRRTRRATCGVPTPTAASDPREHLSQLRRKIRAFSLLIDELFSREL